MARDLWSDPATVRNGWILTTVVVGAGLVCDALGAVFLRDWLMLISVAIAVAFVWRSVRLHDGLAMLNNGLALVLALLAAGYVLLAALAT